MKKLNFSLISLIGYTYLIVISVICYFSPLPDNVKSVLAQPSLVLIPYLVGKPLLFAVRKLLSVREDNDFVVDSLITWLLGIIFIIALEAVLYVNYIFFLDYFIVILLAIGLPSIFIKDRASFANLKRKEIAIVAIYGLLFSILITHFWQYPYANENDYITHTFHMLRIVTDGHPLFFSSAYLPSMDTLYAIMTGLFSIDPYNEPLFLLWSSQFILYPLYAIGLFLLAHQFSKNRLMALLTSIIGTSIVTGLGSSPFPSQATPGDFVNILFIYGLYASLNFRETQERGNEGLSFFGLAGGLLVLVFIILFLIQTTGIIGYEIGFVLPSLFFLVLGLPRAIKLEHRSLFLSLAVLVTGLVFMAKLQGLGAACILFLFLLFGRCLKAISLDQGRIVASSFASITLIVFVLFYSRVIPYPSVPELAFLSSTRVPYMFGLSNLLTYLNSTYPFILFFLFIAGCLFLLILRDEEHKEHLSLVVFASLTMLAYFLPLTHSFRFLGLAHPFIILLGVLAVFRLLQIDRLDLKRASTFLSLVFLVCYIAINIYTHDMQAFKNQSVIENQEAGQVFQVGKYIKDNADKEGIILGYQWYQRLSACYGGVDTAFLWREGQRRDDLITEVYQAETSGQAWERIKVLLESREFSVMAPDKDGRDVDRFYKAPSEVILLYDEMLPGWLGNKASVKKFFDSKYFRLLFRTKSQSGVDYYVFRVNTEPSDSDLIYESLVKNPSFEEQFDPSTSSPIGWKKIWDERWSAELDQEIKYSGNYSYRMETSVTQEKIWGALRSEEDFEVEEGKSYSVTVHAKVTNALKSHFKIGYYLKDEERYADIALTYIPEATQNWKEYSMYVDIPQGVNKISIFLIAGWVQDEAKGKAITWFDDIEIVGPIDDIQK